MMVAAHKPDLRAAKAVRFSTAFVARPGEHGPSQITNLHHDPSVDVAATDFNDLADQLLAKF
jgi:2-haloacid dehalogenase